MTQLLFLIFCTQDTHSLEWFFYSEEGNQKNIFIQKYYINSG